MSLFKILKGAKSRIDMLITPFHDGYAYFTPEDGGLYIDTEQDGEQKRVRVEGSKPFDKEDMTISWDGTPTEESFAYQVWDSSTQGHIDRLYYKVSDFAPPCEGVANLVCTISTETESKQVRMYDISNSGNISYTFLSISGTSLSFDDSHYFGNSLGLIAYRDENYYNASPGFYIADLAWMSEALALTVTNVTFSWTQVDDIDPLYLRKYMASYNPIGTGSFSLNRKPNTTIGLYSFAEGSYTEASGYRSHAEGGSTIASATDSHAEGFNTKATANYSHAEGYYTEASAQYAHAEGYQTKATGNASHAEGESTNASGINSHAEGKETKANGSHSHAEGSTTKANGWASHAEGYETIASGDESHAEGYSTTASGSYSHVEGYKTVANKTRSHAEGYHSTASADSAHAEGYQTTASGTGSHSEGKYTNASGENSHAEGFGTTAKGDYSHTEGKYNEIDNDNKYAHIIGGGTSDERKNIHTVDWDGNAYYLGNVSAAEPTEDAHLTTKSYVKEYVDQAIQAAILESWGASY